VILHLALLLTFQLTGAVISRVFALPLPGPVIGMALLTQPAIAATVGWLAFGELLAPLDVVGMVLVGTVLVLARAGRPGRVR